MIRLVSYWNSCHSIFLLELEALDISKAGPCEAHVNHATFTVGKNSNAILDAFELRLQDNYIKTFFFLQKLISDVKLASLETNVLSERTSVLKIDSILKYIKGENAQRLLLFQRTSLSRIGAKLWNEIPTKLRALPKATFKRRFK